MKNGKTRKDFGFGREGMIAYHEYQEQWHREKKEKLLALPTKEERARMKLQKKADKLAEEKLKIDEEIRKLS